MLFPRTSFDFLFIKKNVKSLRLRIWDEMLFLNFNSFTARGVATFVPGGSIGSGRFLEVNMGEKKLGVIKT